MKLSEAIQKLQQLAEVSSKVPGRPEDAVFVVSDDGKSVSPLAEAYSDDNPFVRVGIILKSQVTVDRTVRDATLQNAAFALCDLIEKIPASEQQTAASISASNLRTAINRFISQL